MLQQNLVLLFDVEILQCLLVFVHSLLCLAHLYLHVEVLVVKLILAAFDFTEAVLGLDSFHSFTMEFVRSK